jgi:hypothetical protein
MGSNVSHDAVRKGWWFSIEIDNEEFLAFIHADTLCARFGASDGQDDQLAAYKKNRERIDAMARQKFLAGAARPIKLDVNDFDAASDGDSSAKTAGRASSS